MASNRRYTRRNPDLERTPVYSDPEKLVTWRNIRERQISPSSGNPNLETFPSVVRRGSEYFELIDIPVDSTSSTKLPPEPLIDLQNSPLGFCQEVSSSFNPFLKKPC
jgi:hypothetical protein